MCTLRTPYPVCKIMQLRWKMCAVPPRNATISPSNGTRSVSAWSSQRIRPRNLSGLRGLQTGSESIRSVSVWFSHKKHETKGPFWWAPRLANRKWKHQTCFYVVFSQKSYQDTLYVGSRSRKWKHQTCFCTIFSQSDTKRPLSSRNGWNIAQETAGDARLEWAHEWIWELRSGWVSLRVNAHVTKWLCDCCCNMWIWDQFSAAAHSANMTCTRPFNV